MKKRSANQAIVDCDQHGRAGFGLVCTHVADAIDRKNQVGFFWGDDTDTARPDAWCAACENALVALQGASSEQWFVDAEFKVLCEFCWDEAKEVCGGFVEPRRSWFGSFWRKLGGS